MRKWIVVAVIGVSLIGLRLYGEEARKPPVKVEPITVVPKEPVPIGKVVSNEDLGRFVPKALKGWRAEKPRGKTERISTFAVTMVSRVFKKGKQRITFMLEDLGSNNPYFYMKEAWKPFVKKTPEGYSKKVMIGNVAAQESFDKKGKRGLIFAVFEKRIQLNISGMGIEDTKVLLELAKGVDFKELKKTVEEKSR